MKNSGKGSFDIAQVLENLLGLSELTTIPVCRVKCAQFRLVFEGERENHAFAWSGFTSSL
jgi:hypothetical protein